MEMTWRQLECDSVQVVNNFCTFIFSNQNLFFKAPACFSNIEAPSCSLSAWVERNNNSNGYIVIF